MRQMLFFLFVLQSIFAYTDPELESLWDSISDVCNPTQKDYQLVENYISNGMRPYLETLKKTSWYIQPDDLEMRMKQVRNFKLLGPNGEMPVFEVHKINVTPETEDRCIIAYSSFNQIYATKLYHMVEEFKACGYSGYFMFRIGGFPNIPNGGLKASPFFTWKHEFIREARSMGFKKIVAIDASFHPVCDLSEIFETLDARGYFLLSSVQGHLPYNPPQVAVDFLKIPFERRFEIPWLPGHIIGFNFNDLSGTFLYEKWDQELRKLDEFICLGADELIMTALGWRYHYPPIDSFDRRLYQADFPPDQKLISDRRLLFFLDTHRFQSRNGWGQLWD